MSELTVGVNSTETLWTVDEVPDSEFEFYTIGSEIVRVSSGAPGGDPGYAVGQTIPATIRVRRGTNDTTPASHLSGAALTAANAFSDSSVPDPATGDDGDVPQVDSGVYVLGPTSGALSIRIVEVVVAFGDADAGVTLVALAAGEQLLSFAAFLETAVTATEDTYLLGLFAGAELLTITQVAPDTSFQTFSASIGQSSAILPARGVTVSVKKTAGSVGTWTAGSLRFVALAGSAA